MQVHRWQVRRAFALALLIVAAVLVVAWLRGESFLKRASDEPPPTFVGVGPVPTPALASTPASTPAPRPAWVRDPGDKPPADPRGQPETAPSAAANEGNHPRAAGDFAARNTVGAGPGRAQGLVQQDTSRASSQRIMNLTVLRPNAPGVAPALPLFELDEAGR